MSDNDENADELKAEFAPESAENYATSARARAQKIFVLVVQHLQWLLANDRQKHITNPQEEVMLSMRSPTAIFPTTSLTHQPKNEREKTHHR